MRLPISMLPAGSPMQEVVDSLAKASAADVRAIAFYGVQHEESASKFPHVA